MTMHYLAGQQAALHKVGMQLSFNNAQQANDHAKTRKTVGQVAGIGGSVAGGMAGAAAGGAVGNLPGSIAGGIVGGELGSKAMAMPATTAYDAQHDVRQKAEATRSSSLGRMNAAAGLPTGTR